MLKPTPDRRFNLMLVGLAGLNFIPHVVDHPLIILTIGLACLVWRIGYEYQKVKLPHYFVKAGLVALAIYFVFYVHNTLLGVEAATALLISAIALKLIDNVKYRDAMVLLFFNFLLLMAKFLISQTLAMTLFAFFNLVVITALLFQLHKGKDMGFDLRSLLKTGLKLTLQTGPLLILLFFVFPRFTTGFFALNNQSVASSGFSGELNPGSVGGIVNSNELAFRVKIENEKVGPRNLYWRGEVLDGNDGLRWYKKASTMFSMGRYKPATEGLYKQEITLEPGYGKWLFALDAPEFIQFDNDKKQIALEAGYGNVFKLKLDTGQRLVYTAYSNLDGKNRFAQANLNRYLGGVNNASDEIISLVDQLTESAQTTQEKAQSVLKYFAQNFRYTLNPGPMQSNSVDEFLFETKQGFCEHFAASFSYLMRVAGVPSRVVLGFQGGKPNDLLPGYLTVKESDAHAWAEIWDAETSRWQRWDPTQIVAPMRLELGGQVYHSLPEEAIQAGLDRQQLQSIYDSGWLQKYFGQVLLYSEFAAIQWNEFLLTYDEKGQAGLLKKLGLGFLEQSHLALISVILLIGFFFWRRYRTLGQKNKQSVEQRVFKKLVKDLERKGFEKLASEGERTYLNRLRSPSSEDEINEFEHLYLTGRYSSQSLSNTEKKRLREIGRNLVSKTL